MYCGSNVLFVPYKFISYRLYVVCTNTLPLLFVT